MNGHFCEKLSEIIDELTDLADYVESGELSLPLSVILSSLDDDSNPIKDLVLEIFSNDDLEHALHSVDLDKLLMERLYIQGIDTTKDYKLGMASCPNEFQANLLTLMLATTFNIWKVRYKDMPYQQLKNFVFPRDIDMTPLSSD